MSRFFINRPIVAMVISILTVLVGLVVMASLPIAQYPAIVPPEMTIQTNYIGADSQTIEQSVAVPIEQQLSGVDNMNYMISVNAASGIMRTTVNFDVAADPNVSLMLTQLRVQQAVSQLPADVTTQGVTVQKSFSAPMMLVAIYSPDARYTASFLANYAFINVVDQVTRVRGIGSTQVFGAGRYAMRLWVKPDQLTKLGITVPDVTRAVQTQNTVNPAGKVGGDPAPGGQEFTYSVRAQGRLSTPEEFENIILRETPDGGVVKVKDVARVELAAADYNLQARLNGKPSAIVAIYQLPGSNAIQAAEGVKKLMKELKSRFPEGVDYAISLDTTLAVSEGIHEIGITFAIAIALVIGVVYVFLQGWRPTIIPLLAVPVSLIGTFAVFPLFGFSINTLSLFGLVLAIGLVVDDAIVVVEAVERHIEEGKEPKEAALIAMQEISGPVIGIALVLAAVFVPTVFVPGITGRLYQQFAVTIAISVILSAFNALSLSPALAALLLKPRKPSGGVLGAFNRGFDKATRGYVRVSGVLVRHGWITIALLVVCTAVAIVLSKNLPSGFLPEEDPGYSYVSVQLPSSSSSQRTVEVARQVQERLSKIKGVKNVTSVIGFNLLSTVQTTYNAFFFVSLEPWSSRTDKQAAYKVIQNEINKQVSSLPEAIGFGFSPPAIPGVGTSAGFTFLLEDRSGKDIGFLSQQLNTFLEAARKRPEIGQISTTFLPAVPQQFVEVDREKVLKQGVPVEDVYRTIQCFMGGIFVNYFNRFGRQWQVYVQAEDEYRTDVKKLDQFSVRGSGGQMVSLAGLTHFESRPGPEFVMHYNLYKCAQLNGSAKPGYSSAQAMQALEQVFHETMPVEMGYDYMGMSFQEKKAQEGVSATVIFGLSLLFVFLILAALYESWKLPFSVLLSTPVAVFGAFLALYGRRVLSFMTPNNLYQFENNLYAQIGMVMLIGLAAKNAILIVEFAKEEYEKGKPLREAALEGARLRLRPILMTSFAFILGCVPLWFATGAGSVAREVMGTTVVGGMLAASLIGIFLVPSIFVMVEGFGHKKK